MKAVALLAFGKPTHSGSYSSLVAAVMLVMTPARP
jgi:hypothetical protein